MSVAWDLPEILQIQFGRWIPDPWMSRAGRVARHFHFAVVQMGQMRQSCLMALVAFVLALACPKPLRLCRPYSVLVLVPVPLPSCSPRQIVPPLPSYTCCRRSRMASLSCPHLWLWSLQGWIQFQSTESLQNWRTSSWLFFLNLEFYFLGCWTLETRTWIEQVGAKAYSLLLAYLKIAVRLSGKGESLEVGFCGIPSHASWIGVNFKWDSPQFGQ